MYIIDSSRSCLVLLVYHSMIDKLHILSGLRTAHGFILVLFICLFVLLYFYLVFFFSFEIQHYRSKNSLLLSWAAKH